MPVRVAVSVLRVCGRRTRRVHARVGGPYAGRDGRRVRRVDRRAAVRPTRVVVRPTARLGAARRPPATGNVHPAPYWITVTFPGPRRFTLSCVDFRFEISLCKNSSRRYSLSLLHWRSHRCRHASEEGRDSVTTG